MPYQNFSKTVKGKRKYCMRNKRTGKEYCYDSAKEREEGKEYTRLLFTVLSLQERKENDFQTDL